MTSSTTRTVTMMVRRPTRRHNHAKKVCVGLGEMGARPASCLISFRSFLRKSMKFSLHIKRRRAYELVVIMIARTKNAAIDIRDASSSLTCMLKMLAEKVSGMKKKASSVSFVTLSASAMPRLLSTMDMFATRDLLIVRIQTKSHLRIARRARNNLHALRVKIHYERSERGRQVWIHLRWRG